MLGCALHFIPSLAPKPPVPVPPAPAPMPQAPWPNTGTRITHARAIGPTEPLSESCRKAEDHEKKMSLYEKWSGSPFLKILGGLNIAARIGKIFLIDFAIGQPHSILTKTHKTHSWDIAEIKFLHVSCLSLSLLVGFGACASAAFQKDN